MTRRDLTLKITGADRSDSTELCTVEIPDHPDAGVIRSEVIRNRVLIAAIIKERGIVKKWEELVQYVLSLGNPKVPRQQSGLPTLDGYNLKGIEL